MKQQSIWVLFLKLLFGQVIAFIVSTTGMFTTILIEKFSFQIPILQCLGAYVLLFLILALLCLTNKRQKISSVPMSTYAFLAFCDANANILIVYAYQFSDMPTIQLLMCFSIPSVMVLSVQAHRYGICQSDHSYATKKSPAGRRSTKSFYSHTQFISACICIVGIVSLIVTDSLKSSESLLQIDKARIFGDALSIFGVILYAMSNVGCELLVKRKVPVKASENEIALQEIVYWSYEKDITQTLPSTTQTSQYILEYLQNLGLFGSLWCVIELVLFEGMLRLFATQSLKDQLSLCAFNWKNMMNSTFLAYFCSFCSVMVLIYLLIPVFLVLSSATFLNLSLLATQFYVLMWASLFFAYKIQVFFVVSFALTMLGAVIYECDFG